LDLPTLAAHPILPTLFSFTNTFNGIVGFYWADRLIRANKHLAAHSLWVTSYVAMFSILGLGYNRFLYNGTAAQWAAKGPTSSTGGLVGWFGGDVFCALLVMGIPLLPGLWYVFVCSFVILSLD
jgi:hypothetical protein